MNDDNLVSALKMLNGVAVANVNEPSPGDLARVLEHNRQLTDECMKRRIKISELEAERCQAVSDAKALFLALKKIKNVLDEYGISPTDMMLLAEATKALDTIRERYLK